MKPRFAAKEKEYGIDFTRKDTRKLTKSQNSVIPLYLRPVSCEAQVSDTDTTAVVLLYSVAMTQTHHFALQVGAKFSRRYLQSSSKSVYIFLA
jgi:hypothetical protein